MEQLCKIKERLIDEIIQLGQKQDLSRQDIETIKVLASGADHICNLLKAMERDENSNRSMRYSRRRPAYDDGMGGISESAYRGSSYRYSRHGGGQDELQSALQEIRDPNTRMKIQKLIEEME
jgi:hypothetical protein